MTRDHDSGQENMLLDNSRQAHHRRCIFIHDSIRVIQYGNQVWVCSINDHKDTMYNVNLCNRGIPYTKEALCVTLRSKI